MEAVLIGIVILLAGLVVWLVLQNSKGAKNDGAVEEQVAELRRDLQTIASAQAQTAGSIQAISQSVTQRLDGVSTALREGVTNSAQIASAGQSAIANELKNTREQIGLIQKQLGEVNEQSRGLSQATKLAGDGTRRGEDARTAGRSDAATDAGGFVAAVAVCDAVSIQQRRSGGCGDFSARRGN